MLLNKAAVRKYIRNRLAASRPHLAEKFTVISNETFLALDGFLRVKIDAEIKDHISTGKTFKISVT